MAQSVEQLITQIQELHKSLVEFTANSAEANIEARKNRCTQLTLLRGELRSCDDILKEAHARFKQELEEEIKLMEETLAHARACLNSIGGNQLSILKKTESTASEGAAPTEAKKEEETPSPPPVKLKTSFNWADEVEAEDDKEPHTESKPQRPADRALIPTNGAAKSWAAMVHAGKAPKATSLRPAPSNGGCVEVEIAPNVHLPVFLIAQDEECHKYRGWWCYNSQRGRFYLSVNGFILSAVVGDIQGKGKKPRKLLEDVRCTRENLTQRKFIDPNSTDDYVPPHFCKGKTDIRCYSNRTCYIPASAKRTSGNEDSRYAMRIGSADVLSEDLERITRRDRDFFLDLTGSYLLVSTKLLYYIP